MKEWVAAAQIVSTSRVAYVEARAEIARKHREGQLSNNVGCVAEGGETNACGSQ